MTVIDERLRLAAIGDMRAFEELYQHYHRRVFSLCLRMTGNGSEAEDLTRCFRSPFRNLKTFRGEASFYDPASADDESRATRSHGPGSAQVV